MGTPNGRRKSGKLRIRRHSGGGFVRLFRKARKGVVFIRTLKREEEPQSSFPFFYTPAPEPKEVVLGIGTGIVLTRDGLILTSEHVVNGAQTIFVKTFDGKVHRGKHVWGDAEQDVALLKIDSSVPLAPLPLGSSGKSKIGEIVMSVGNPLGLENSITSGIISGKHRKVKISERELEDIIQTDCAINPGSSGGPLINRQGQVIGMNAFMAKNKNGLGFALGMDGILARIKRYLK
jgi:serine protease Do